MHGSVIFRWLVFKSEYDLIGFSSYGGSEILSDAGLLSLILD